MSQQTMKNFNSYDYGSPELREKIEEILKRPTGINKAIRQYFSSEEWISRTIPNRPFDEIEYQAVDVHGEREWWPVRKGTRKDAILIEKIRTAIHTNRITKEELKLFYREMFGKEHENHLVLFLEKIQSL